MSAIAGTLSLGRVALTVHDLEAMRDFYAESIGLGILSSEGERATLGAGNRVLLELRRDTAARRSSPREAGLFHTAFLLPSRAALADWVRHALAKGVAVSGASDHLVSEALYLSDPEGNGIEIYADRPRDRWTWRDGTVAMATQRFDVDALMRAEAASPWRGLPDGAILGHVHLQVGALEAAEDFYAGILGLPVTTRYPGAIFYAADGYHHHLATNVWNSRAAPARALPATGIADVEIRMASGLLSAVEVRAKAGGAWVRTAAGSLVVTDPWNTSLTLVPREM